MGPSFVEWSLGTVPAGGWGQMRKYEQYKFVRGRRTVWGMIVSFFRNTARLTCPMERPE